MRLVSWNVNGLRACLGKGFQDVFDTINADMFCLQETKMQPGQAQVACEDYEEYWYSAEKKGYSGTALFTRKKPIEVVCGMGMDAHDHEGRIITAEYENFYLVTCYTPNSQSEPGRLDYPDQWEDDFRDYVKVSRTRLGRSLSAAI